MHIKYVIEWNSEKGEKLKSTRDIDMDEIADCIKDHRYLAIETVPNQDDHPGQKMFILIYKGYIHCVPFVTEGNILFLKTAFPSRLYQKKYGGENDEA